MIRDAEAWKAARASWKTLRVVLAMLQTHANAPPLSPFGFVRSSDYDKVAFSLLVINAFAGLEEVLEQLRVQGVFTSSRRTLADLMTNSLPTLAWKNFAALDAARLTRNQIAHEQRFLDPKACENILDLIETELLGWGVLAQPLAESYSISIGRRDDS